MAGGWRRAHHGRRRAGAADRRIVSLGVFDLMMPGLLVAATGCGVASAVLIVDAVPLTWLCAALSLWVGASFTHRAKLER